MTEPTNNQTPQNEASEQSQTPPNGSDAPAENEPDTFDREYVTKLRGEAAEARTALKDATTRGDQLFEVLKLRSMETAAGDLLQALDHMPDDDPRYWDNAGFPNLDGMREVAQEIAESRPYLSKVRGDVHQGAKDQATERSWSDVFREAVGVS